MVNRFIVLRSLKISNFLQLNYNSHGLEIEFLKLNQNLKYRIEKRFLNLTNSI